MTTNTFQNNGLQFVMRHVDNLPAARAFYIDILGLTPIDDQPEFVQFAPVHGQGASFALGLTGENREGVETWWFVDNADAAHAELLTKGVKILKDPYDAPFGRVFCAADPAGGPVFFLQLR